MEMCDGFYGGGTYTEEPTETEKLETRCSNLETDVEQLKTRMLDFMGVIDDLREEREADSVLVDALITTNDELGEEIDTLTKALTVAETVIDIPTPDALKEVRSRTRFANLINFN